jgi:uncharacterized protein
VLYAVKPWYRHAWPWLLMAGPAAVLVAGAVTTWIAFASADGLVAEDYYKQGLGINRRLAREDAAQKLGVAAAIRMDASRVRVELKGATPEALFVHLAHATRAGHDVRLRLTPGPDGVYSAELPPLPAGRWRAAIEDPRGAWRILKELS